MTDRPHVAPFDAIDVGNIRCIVTRVRSFGDVAGDLQVVLNPDKPTTHDVNWTANGWAFSAHGDFNGHATRIESLAPFVTALRQIRQAS